MHPVFLPNTRHGYVRSLDIPMGPPLVPQVTILNSFDNSHYNHFLKNAVRVLDSDFASCAFFDLLPTFFYLPS